MLQRDNNNRHFRTFKSCQLTKLFDFRFPFQISVQSLIDTYQRIFYLFIYLFIYLLNTGHKSKEVKQKEYKYTM